MSWEADVLELLLDIAEFFDGTDAPLGERARTLFYAHGLEVTS